jgi:nitrous oxide reductase accessory protein NosL
VSVTPPFPLPFEGEGGGCSIAIGDCMKKKNALFGFALIFSLTLTLTLSLFVSHSGDRKPIQPASRDKCPVCGMFVAKYPDWVAEIIFKDGSYAVFDGAKDMFKYYFNFGKYNPSKKLSDIDSIYVTNYYDLTFIDGYKAVYVIGSDVYGPMGRELIPFEKEEDAREFMRDHKGKSLLRFKSVTMELIKQLD